jgi:hypothetical protein
MSSPQNENIMLPEELMKMNITINLGFLISILNLLTNITPRTQWQSKELYQAGTIIENLKNIVQDMEKKFNERNIDPQIEN